MNVWNLAPKVARTALAVATLAAPTFACAQTGTPGQSQPSTQTSPGANSTQPSRTAGDAASDPNSSAQGLGDRAFLHKAAEGGMAEIQLGQLASQKASSQDVKDFGTRMVKDHTELNNQLQPIADSLGVKAPKKLSKKDQAELDKLNGLSGNDFDTEYLSYMMKDHKADIRDFRQEATSTTNTTLQPVVQKGQQVVEQHYSMLQSLAKAKGLPGGE